MTDTKCSDDYVRTYEPHWGATDVDYEAPWDVRRDGSRCSADRMRVYAHLAGWHQMRQIAPQEQWSTELCDAIVEAALRTVQDWTQAP